MDWLIEYLPKILVVLGSMYETYRQVKGSKLEKAYAVGEVAYEKAKEANYNEVFDKLDEANGDLQLMVPEWRRKMDEADANLRALRPKKGRLAKVQTSAL